MTGRPAIQTTQRVQFVWFALTGVVLAAAVYAALADMLPFALISVVIFGVVLWLLSLAWAVVLRLRGKA